MSTCFLDRQRLILQLLQNFHQARAAVELLLRGGIQIAAELREGRELAVLREVQTQRTGHLPHGFDLRRAADAADRVADVDGGPDALVEQIRLEEDLTVGDRNDVRRDVADKSPACVSMIGSAVSDPPPSSLRIFAARSSRRECR